MVRAIGAQVNQIPQVGGAAAGGSNPNPDPNADDVGLFVGWNDTDGAPADLGPDGVSLTVNNSPTLFDSTYIPNLIDFNGTNQNLTWAYSAPLRTDVDWTLELALVFDATTGYAFNMFGTNGGVFVRTDTNRVWVRFSNFSVAEDLYSPTLSTGVTYFFTATHDVSTGAVALLENGLSVDTGTLSGSVGNWQTGGSAYFGGTTSNYFNGKGAFRFTGGVIRTDPVQVTKDIRLVQ